MCVHKHVQIHTHTNGESFPGPSVFYSPPPTSLQSGLYKLTKDTQMHLYAALWWLLRDFHLKYKTLFQSLCAPKMTLPSNIMFCAISVFPYWKKKSFCLPDSLQNLSRSVSPCWFCLQTYTWMQNNKGSSCVFLLLISVLSPLALGSEKAPICLS